MGLFGKAKSAVDRLEEEKAKIQMQLLKRKANAKPVVKSTRIIDESPEDYGKRLTQNRRKGLY
jgi:hypothetical protein